VLAGEPLAVDLANTVKMATEPPTELLGDAHRLPDGAEPPSPGETVRLRAVVRSVLTSHLDDRPFDPEAIETLNAYAAGAPSSPQLAVTADRAERHTTWGATGADLVLAAVARSVIDVVTGPDSERLRQCDSDACSMMFVATNARRRWCSSAVCGNRERVARHARLHQRQGMS
jgi:predicted RNA-binding Zn ribbon-like protein